MVSRALVAAVFAAFAAPQAQAMPVVLFETDADEPGGQELFLGDYASFDALLAGTDSGIAASDIDVSPEFSTTGIVFDGTQFIVMFESDADAPGRQELFLGFYETLDDLLNGTDTVISASDIDVSPQFSTTGLVFAGSPGGTPPPGGVVPAPAAAWLLGGGLLALGALRAGGRRTAKGAAGGPRRPS